MRVSIPEKNTYIDFPDGISPEETQSIIESNWDSIKATAPINSGINKKETIQTTPEQSLWGKAKSYFYTPDVDKGKASNIMGLSEQTGISPSQINKQYTEAMGEVVNRTYPTARQAVQSAMVPALTTAMVANPVGTLVGVGTFMGLDELVNIGVSKIKDEPYKFQGGKGISDLLEAEGLSKDAIDLTQFIIEGVAAGGVTKGAKGIVKGGYERFGELTRSIKDKKQRIDFVNTVAKEVKETGKTPNEIAQSKLEVPQEKIPVDVKPTEPIVEPQPTEPIKTPEIIQSDTTGIKNAVTLAEREARGLSEVETQVRKVVPSFDEGKRLVDSGELDPRLLAKELVEKPRTHTPEEAAALLYDRMKLKNEQKATMDLIEKAAEKGDAIAEAEARVKLESIEEAYNLNDIADRLSGTEWSAAGRMRQQLIREDYSLASMLQKARVENGGKPLPANLRTKYETLAKRYEEAEAKIKAHEEKIAKLESTTLIRRLKNEAAYEQRKAGRVKTKETLSTEFTYLNRELSAVLGKLHAGIDPQAVLILGKMAKNRVQSGIVTMEGVVDSIYMAVKEAGYELSKRDIRDAISGYGKIIEMSKDPLKVQLRELKRQMRLVSALEDAKAGEAPLRSGLQRDKPSDRVRELEKEVKEAMRESGIDTTNARSPEDQWKTWIQSFKTRTEHRITDLEKKIERNDFSKKKRTIRELDQEGLDLKFKLDNVKRDYHEAMMKDRLARRTPLQKTGGYAAEAVNTLRAVLTSFDLSAVLRQGFFIVMPHPIRGIQSLPAMFKSLLSDKGRFAVEQEIMSRPTYRLMEESKLYLSDHGQKLSQMEEQYMSRWAEKIPGVSASQRAYTTFLNEIRANSFDAMVKGLSKGEKPTPVELNAISNYINVATGRGNLGMKENALVGLNTIFFAPRYVASRFQYLAGQPLYRGTARTRKLIATEYARTLIGLGTVYTLAKASGATIETDPRSTDFGKIKYGKTRVDPLAGLAQITTLLGRLTLGATKTQSGKIVPLREQLVYGIKKPKVAYGSDNIGSVLFRFLRSKLSPVLGAGVDIAVGEDIVGNKVTPTTVATRSLIPLSFNDIYETMKEQGVPAGTALSILAAFGMSVQTYDTKRKK